MYLMWYTPSSICRRAA